MPGFERYVREITGRLELPEATKEGIRQEALAHLEDEAERLVAEGKTREEAEALAVEAFGKGDAIAGLVDEALAGRQERYRRKKAIAAAAVVAGFGLLAVVVGAGFNLASSGLTAWVGGGIAPGTQVTFGVVEQALFLAAAALIAYKLSKVSVRLAVYAALGVFAFGMVKSLAVNVIFFYWQGIHTSIVSMSPAELSGFLCFVVASSLLTVIVIGAWGFFLRRDKGQVRLFLACLALAAVSAAWAVGGMLAIRARGDLAGFTGWSSHLSAGIGLLTRVVFVWFLARAMSGRRRAGEAGSEGQQPQMAS
jgi:hypothetical protein